MLIGKKYKIESDALNVTLFRQTVVKKGSKAGKVNWTPIGYYSRIQHALKGLVDLEVKETELKDLKTVVAKQEELYKLIIELHSKEE